MMISAIPMNDDRIASHFSKAHSLLFVNEQGQELSRQPNPALAAGCAGKQRLVELLLANKAQRVVVRNIGERMLGKLLAHQLQVVQTDCGRRSVAELANPAAAPMPALTDASAGHLSFNYELKQAGGKACSHGCAAGQPPASPCCGTNHEAGSRHCQEDDHGNREQGNCNP